MVLKGTLKQIGADVGDWVQREDKEPYGPLTLHEILTDDRDGFWIVKKSERPLPKNCRARLRAEGKAYPKSSCQACGSTIKTGVRCLHMFPEPDLTKPHKPPLVDKDLQPVGGLVLASESPLVGEVPAEETRPSILARLDDFIERSGVNTKGEWEGLRRVIAPALSGKLVVDMAGAMDKITPELIAAMAPLLTQPAIKTLEIQVADHMGVLDRVGKHLGVEFGNAGIRGIGDRLIEGIDKLYATRTDLRQEVAKKEEEVTAAKAQTGEIGFHMLEIEGVVMAMIDTVAQLRDATGLTDENTPAEIVSAGLKRIADADAADKALIRIRGLVAGAGKNPEEIANEVVSFFETMSGDYWVTYDYQTGQWIVQQEPIKVVRPDSEILVLRPVGKVNLDVANRAFRAGYRARLADLMQGGSQSSSDFFRDGKYAGRFHAFFPKATVDEKIAHYEEMIGWEKATKEAVPLDFGDFRMKKTDGTPVEKLIGEVQRSLLDEIQAQDRLHRDPKTDVLPELAWKESDGIDGMRRELLGEEIHLPFKGVDIPPDAKSGKLTGC